MPAPGIFFLLASTGLERFYFVVETTGDPELHIGVRNPTSNVAVGYAARVPKQGGDLYDASLVRLTEDPNGPHNHLLCGPAASTPAGDLLSALTHFQVDLPRLYNYLETLL